MLEGFITKVQLENISTICTIVTGFISLRLNIKQYVATWYVGLFMDAVNVVIYWRRSVYALCLGRLLSMVSKCYGIYKWLSGSTDKKRLSLPISRTSLQTWGRVFCFGFLVWGIVYHMVSYVNAFDPNEKKPNEVVSSLMVAIMLMGQWLSAHKKLETYLVWFGYNMVSIWFHYREFDSWLFVKYVLYLGFSVYGYYGWRSAYHEQSRKKAAE